MPSLRADARHRPQPIKLSNASEQDVGTVGGKALALGRLIRYGAPVPPGFVVPPQLDIVAAQTQILAAFDQLGAEHVAVRSSAAGEDGHNQSWAGQFESFLYVRRDKLLDRIQACRDSGRSSRAQAYDAQHSVMPVAVIVQTMVASDVSGVLFTANPITKQPNEVIIEAVYGLGEQLVQGLATPDNYVINKTTGHTLRQTIAEKTVQLVGGDRGLKEEPVPPKLQTQAALGPPQITELAQLARHLEAKFNRPLDIEWAYRGNKLYILQARPITTL